MKIYNKQGQEIKDPKQREELEKEIQSLISNRSLSNGEVEKRPFEHGAKNAAFERFLKSIEAQERKTQNPELTDSELNDYWKKYNDILAKYGSTKSKITEFKFNNEKY